jgi:hypothetical protein
VVRLPETASANARLLIRFGDERRELEHELPWTFEIASAERSVSAPRTPVFARGEAPRGGERGVVAWAEASRNGGGFRLLEAAGRALGIRDFRSGAGIAMPLLAPTSKGPILPSCALLSHPAGRAKRLVRPSTAEPRHEESIEPRERTCRINE